MKRPVHLTGQKKLGGWNLRPNWPAFIRSLNLNSHRNPCFPRSPVTAHKLLLCPALQELNLWSQDSHLFCCRSGVAEHEEGAAVVFCRGTRHAHGARKAHSSSPRGRMGTLHRRGEGERRHRGRHAGIVIAQVGALWCGVHGLMALRFSALPRSPVC